MQCHRFNTYITFQEENYTGDTKKTLIKAALSASLSPPSITSASKRLPLWVLYACLSQCIPSYHHISKISSSPSLSDLDKIRKRGQLLCFVITKHASSYSFTFKMILWRRYGRWEDGGWITESRRKATGTEKVLTMILLVFRLSREREQKVILGLSVITLSRRSWAIDKLTSCRLSPFEPESPFEPGLSFSLRLLFPEDLPLHSSLASHVLLTLQEAKFQFYLINKMCLIRAAGSDLPFLWAPKALEPSPQPVTCLLPRKSSFFLRAPSCSSLS